MHPDEIEYEAERLLISAVPTDKVTGIWQKVAPLLDKAVQTAPGTIDIVSLLQEILEGRHTLWVIFEEETGEMVASFTTCVVQHPLGNILAMPFVGGTRMKEWLGEGLTLMEKYAKDTGCSGMEGYGRRAWERWVGPHGLKPAYICYQKMWNDNGHTETPTNA